MAVLPWRATRNWPVTNAHGPKPPGENFTVNRITVPNQIFGRPIPPAGFGNLSGHPFGRWMGRHAQPQREDDAKLIPGVRVVTLERGGHFLALDRPQELRDLIIHSPLSTLAS